MIKVYSSIEAGAASLTANNERRLANRAVLCGFGIPSGLAHASSLHVSSACEQLERQLAATSDKSLNASTIF
jgi:hypothetical protein